MADREGTMLFLLGGVLVVALAIAFAAQWLRAPQRRTRLIVAAAAVPSIILIAFGTVLAIGEDDAGIWIVVPLAFGLCAFLYAGLVGAIIGSELASLTRRLLRRQR